MLAEFEQRLADVLGARMPAPLTGSVDVAPGPDADDSMRLILGVEGTELLEEDFLAHRDVRLPTSPNFRRVLRLRCRVGIRPLTLQGRSGQVSALDSALFLLDAPDFRDGRALLGGDDPGFLIEKTRLSGTSGALLPNPEHALSIHLVAEGWFWPVGAPEQAGPEIQELLIRAGVLQLQLSPANPALAAGGPPVELTLRLGATGTMRLRGSDAEPESLPFGLLALTLRDAGARPGAGTLGGGFVGADDVRLVLLNNGEATFTYTPPADPAVDFLVVALEDGEGRLGAELARFRLNVR